MFENGSDLSPVTKALIEAGQSVIHVSGAASGLLVSVSCEDQYGTGVAQAWVGVAELANRFIREFVIGFMRDIAEPNSTVKELADVTAGYFGILHPGRIVMAQLLEWAAEVAGVETGTAVPETAV